jgi:hypothetical protein
MLEPIGLVWGTDFDWKDIRKDVFLGIGPITGEGLRFDGEAVVDLLRNVLRRSVIKIGVVAQGLNLAEVLTKLMVKVEGVVELICHVSALLGGEGFDDGNGEHGLMEENVVKRTGGELGLDVWMGLQGAHGLNGFREDHF